MMNDSVLVLADICDAIVDCEHKTAPTQDRGIPLIRTTDIQNGKLNLTSAKKISEETYNEWSQRMEPNAEDIILAREAPVGEVGYVAKGMRVCLGQRTVLLRINRKVADPRYILYLLCTKPMRHKLSSLASGSVVPHLNMKDIRVLTLPKLPNLEKQKAIANILGSLDDKVELNQCINMTLEAIGKAIFRHWFVDFEFPDEQGKPYKSSGGKIVDSNLGEIPNKWRRGKLMEIADLTMGISPKGTSYNDFGTGKPLLNGAADFQDALIIPRKWTTEPIRICKKGSLLFCIRATIGNLVFADREYCLGRGVAALNPKYVTFTEFVYYTLQHSLNRLVSKASGSVILGLSKNDIKELPIVIPDNLTINRFHELCSGLFRKIDNQRKNSFTLTQIRDNLLPKLVSGKIRVPITKNNVEVS